MNNENYLRNCGFRKVFNEDRSASWMKKKIICPFLKKCSIEVEKGYIYVYCQLVGGGLDQIHKSKFTPDNLNKVYTWLIGKKNGK